MVEVSRYLVRAEASRGGLSDLQVKAGNNSEFL